MLQLFGKSLFPTRQLMRAMDLDRVPERGGLYFMFVKDGRGLLRRSGCAFDHANPPIRVGAYDLLNIGASESNIRGRIKCHFSGASAFRHYVGMLLQTELNLRPQPDFQTYEFFGEGEDRLTGWLCANAAFAFLQIDQPMPMERFLIKNVNPPLNLYYRKSDPFAKRLMNEFQDFLAAHA